MSARPATPPGAVMPLPEWEKLFALSDRYGFVIASDECYSEIYFRDERPWVAWKPPRNWVAADFATWSPSPACPSAAMSRPAQRLCGRRCRADQGLLALPHLPRQRHGPGRASTPASPPGSMRRMWCTTAPLPRKICRGHAHPGAASWTCTCPMLALTCLAPRTRCTWA